MEKDSQGLSWFDLETQTRKIIYELLQPSLTRQTEDSDEIGRIQKVNES